MNPDDYERILNAEERRRESTFDELCFFWLALAILIFCLIAGAVANSAE